jgi:predicted nucleotidyltransferase
MSGRSPTGVYVRQGVRGPKKIGEALQLLYAGRRQKASETNRFRPRYAGANLGHPSRFEKHRNIGQNRVMDNRQVISKLREHRDELTAAGIVHLRVFGSVARGEANDSSDVDLIAEFDETMKLTLLDMVGLENRLSELLEVKVDLTPAETLKQRVRATADKEAVVAF